MSGDDHIMDENRKLKLAVLGANEFQKPLILRAREKNLETHVFAWLDGAVAAQDADYFYPISIVEKEQILEKCREIGIDGITSIGSDVAVATMNYVSEKMGLTGNPVSSSQICMNKFKMREKLREGGIYVPGYQCVSSSEEINTDLFRFPVIVKPTDRSGSRGIMKVSRPEDLPAAVEEAAGYSFENKAIIEDYIDGPEFSCECISRDGEHTMLAVTLKFTTGEPHYIETGHIEPAPLSEEAYDIIRRNVFRALTVLGIRNGASHSEFKYQDGEVKFIEIGARMGGDYIGSSLVYLSTGMDYTGMVIDVALGRQLDFTVKREPHPVCVRFIMDKSDLEEYRKIKSGHTIIEEDISGADEDREVLDSATRLGYYIYFL